MCFIFGYRGCRAFFERPGVNNFEPGGQKLIRKRKKTHTKKSRTSRGQKAARKQLFAKATRRLAQAFAKSCFPLFSKNCFLLWGRILGQPFANIWCAIIGWSFSNGQRIAAQSAHAVKTFFTYFWPDLVFFLPTFWFSISEIQFHFRLAVKNKFWFGNMFCCVLQIQ